MSASSPAPPQPAPGSIRPGWIEFLVYPLAALLIYAPSLGGGFLWDDNVYIADNPLMRDPAGWLRAWTNPLSLPDPYPLVFSVLWTCHRLWGMDPVGYHVVCIILHGVNAALAGRLLARLGGPLPAVAALLFLIHPGHAESVAWITELKNTLSGLFYLLAVLAWLNWLARGGWSWWVACAGCFLAALSAKTTVVTLPVVAMAIALMTGGKAGVRRAAGAVPLLAAGLAAAALVVRFQVEAHQSEGGAYDFTFLQRCLIASRALWFYAAKFLWPAPLMAVYPRWEVSAAAPVMWLWPAGLMAVAAGVVVLWRRGIRLPAWGLGYLALTVSPALGFFNYSTMRLSLVADHYQYLAGLGLFAVVLGCARAVRAGRCLSIPSRVGAGLAAAALVLATLAAAGNHRSAGRLFTHNARGNPQSAFVQWNAAAGLTQEGRNEEALAHAERAVELAPEDAKAVSTLAGVLMNLGRAEEAAAVIGRLPSVEGDPQAMLIAAKSADARGLTAEAASRYERLVGAFPTHAPALTAYGVFLGRTRRHAEAEQVLTRALALDPTNVPARIARAASIFENGREEEAVREVESVAEANPADSESRFLLGVMLIRMKRADEGRARLDEAARLNPALAERLRTMNGETPR